MVLYTDKGLFFLRNNMSRGKQLLCSFRSLVMSGGCLCVSLNLSFMIVISCSQLATQDLSVMFMFKAEQREGRVVPA